MEGKLKKKLDFKILHVCNPIAVKLGRMVFKKHLITQD